MRILTVARRLPPLVLLLASACGGKVAAPETASPPLQPQAVEPTATPAHIPLVGETFWAVGDIGDCTSDGDEAVAAILAAAEGVIGTAGDTVYTSGKLSEFARCFDPAWGPLKGRIRPALGNHDYGTANAKDYFGYFGAAAGEPGKGYYSYDVGSWHIIVLNSNCEQVPDGCGFRSAQQKWLDQELASHPAACTLAYWHHPRFTSGLHGNDGAMAILWQTLYDGGADIVVSGHDHHYERFALQDGAGHADTERGIREFVVGTGGATLYPLAGKAPNSEVRDPNSFGALKFTLAEGAYAWEFVPVPGSAFRDTGEGRCH